MNLYIDQQPFSPSIYPQLCRLYSHKNDPAIKNDEEDNLFGELEGMALEKKVFEGLFRESLEYIKAKSLKINGALYIYEKKNQLKEEKKEVTFNFGFLGSPGKPPSKPELSPGKEKDESIGKESKFKNYLNNMLLLDILHMVSKLLSFNLFQLIQQDENFLALFPNLINLLEFDFSNPLISLAVVNKREKNFKELLEQEKKKQNLMATGLSGIKSLFSDVMENVTGLTKEMAGTLLGQNNISKVVTKKSNVYLDRYNDNFLYSNPLMRSCVSQRNKLNLLGGEDEAKVIKVEKDLKMLIIDIMKQFLSMRHDFLLTNFIAWYQDFSKKEKTGTYNEEKLRIEINENFMTVIPEILKVGIPSLDFKYQIKEEENVLNNIGGNLKNFVGNIGNLINQEEEDTTRYLLKKFKVYAKDKEIKDLDNLLTGVLEEKYTISKTLYPSLIMMFYSTQDPVLECKLLEIIMLSFHQRLKFSNALKDLELLFDKDDIENYLHLSKTVREMKSICEKSEVWISEWLNTGKIQQELNELKKKVVFLIATFHSKSVESKLEINEIEIEVEEEENEFLFINPVRQKIACFLEIHCVLIDFLKDAMHLLDKILKDERIELKDKEQWLALYKKIFLFLKYFVKDNQNNQELLNESLELFMFHMDLDLGQIDLICEIFKNNQGLCENIKMKTLNKFIYNIKTIGRREKFLNIFEILQTANQKPIFECQAKIINALLGTTQTGKNDDSLYHILYLKQEDIEKDKTLMIFDFECKPLNYYLSQDKNSHSYLTQFSESLFGDRPYKYHAKLLKVLALAGQGIQGFNLSNARLRKQFDLQVIFQTLAYDDTITNVPKKQMPKKKSGDELMNKDNNNDDAQSPGSMSPFSKRINLMKKDRNWSKKSIIDTKTNSYGINNLKPALIHYLNQVYLPTIKKEKDEFQNINDTVLIFLLKEFDRIKEISSQEIRNDSFKEYFFIGVLTFLHDYVQCIVSPAVVNENLEFKDNEILFAIAETLVSRLKDLENSLSTDQFKSLEAFLGLYFEKTEELIQNLNNCIEENERKVVKNMSQSNVSINSEVFEEGLDNAVGWKAFLRTCLKSDVLEKEIEKEKKALCESFIKIHLMFDEDERKKYNINIEMKDILQKFVNYIQFALTHKEDKETIMFTLEILMLIFRFI